jgi:hypothetical protein
MLIKLAGKIVEWFWNSPEAKSLLVSLLTKHAASTDNKIDNLLVEFVRTELKV